MKKRILSLLLISLTACEQASHNVPVEITQGVTNLEGVNFVEQVQVQPGKTLIPYQKYQLDNGLTVILHQDKSDPLVHVDVTYHVGSAREALGKSGFAHFFEHMMFQGSEHVADEQHFKLVTEVGGEMNGTTNRDRTNYFQTVPANQLEKMLWLEADRMGFLVDAVTQKKFEVQRETVKNERGQRVDNRPYGRLGERVSAALYPYGHPYSWPVIGFMEDLNRVNVNDLKDFFLRWYGPNNATITIGGDIDIEQTLALTKKYFSSIPKGPEVVNAEKTPVVLASDRYISMEDNVHLPLLFMSFPTVYVRHEDEAPLDLLSTILGGSKTSILYKNLVKNQLAVQASVSHPCEELSCSFNLIALPHPASGKSLADMEKIVRDSLVEFETRGVKDDDLIKAKAQMEAGFVFGLQSVAGKVSQLASYQTFTGDPNYIEQDILRYAQVTKDDVIRVYQQYIKGKHAVIMSVVPNGKTNMIAAQDNYQAKKGDFSNLASVASSDLKLRKAVDSFDRSVIPPAGENKSVTLPEMWQENFTNGIKVLGSQSFETPTTSLLLKIPAGHYYETADKAGMVNLLAQLLNESTTQRSAEEMSKALQKLGSSVNISASNFYLNITINSLTKHFEQTMALVHEKLMMPAFKADEFSRIKNNSIEQVINQHKDASYLASRAYRQLLHSDNIAAMPAGGSQKSLKAISLADVKAFYLKQVKAKNSQIVVVSDLAKPVILSKLAEFKQWQGQGAALNLNLPLAETKMGVIYLVHKDNAAQSAIRIGRRALKHDVTGQYYKAQLMNFPLGGVFNSRLNLNLREDKGYTYGARSGFNGNRLAGFFTAKAAVRADVTDKSIVEFVNEINDYATKGITNDELAFMRQSINQRDALKYETPGAKLQFLAQILEYDLTPSFVKEQADIVESITLAEVNALAKTYLNIEDMLMVVVGNSKVLKPQLEALGYQVIDYSL